MRPDMALLLFVTGTASASTSLLHSQHCARTLNRRACAFGMCAPQSTAARCTAGGVSVAATLHTVSPTSRHHHWCPRIIGAVCMYWRLVWGWGGYAWQSSAGVLLDGGTGHAALSMCQLGCGWVYKCFSLDAGVSQCAGGVGWTWMAQLHCMLAVPAMRCGCCGCSGCRCCGCRPGCAVAGWAWCSCAAAAAVHAAGQGGPASGSGRHAGGVRCVCHASRRVPCVTSRVLRCPLLGC
ncbi:hypothetical protein COO60DRAFT_70545 [Scenedesmus sp. NREL 46B-D3]|nr:hypothetical protein COO60DRAFT_70545 [Scenedesmus sp. NREL 46B-D3]